MHHTRTGSVVVGLVALLLSACGGGGGGGGGDPQPANVAPVARAGTAQSVNAGAAVLLNGTTSSDADGTIASYAWTQTSGTSVLLSNAGSAQPSFTAPGVSSVATLVFSLVVTDNRGTASAASSVTITVNPVVTTVSITGLVRFARVSHATAFPNGLNYASPTMRPARGVIVRALDATTQAVLATTATDASGNYSLSVTPNTNVTLQVVAQMQRGTSQPLPRWDVRVQDGTAASSPYSYTTASFNSNSTTQNIDIPTGISATGTAAGVRASGPFAILDTIYTAIQKVLTAAPAANFPALIIDWGAQAEGTHFDRSAPQNIALLSDLTEDADEFDQHTIAHEFGHYIEHNFSRADNIGGSHGQGDKLDMRVAFGEGFGYAFAAIVLDDPVVRDAFVFSGTQVSSTFNVETNPAIGTGCWCSEASMYSILWDLYDSVPDGSDSVSVQLSAIWDVLTNAQRTTPSMTSIFSFISALKSSQPASAAAINTLVAAQSINSASMDAFASSETNTPYPGLLPLYPVITRGGGPVVVQNRGSTSEFFNKAGNHNFLRFTPITTGSVTISLTTSNAAADRDPDFLVWSGGALRWAGLDSSTQHPEVETFSVTAGTTYIIDVYDCANGCVPDDSTDPPTPQGTPGNYTLTVTIN